MLLSKAPNVLLRNSELLLLWFLGCGLTLSGVTSTSCPWFLTPCSHSDFSFCLNICCEVLLGKRQGNQEKWREIQLSFQKTEWKTFLYWHRNTNWLSVNRSVHLLVAECWGSSSKSRNKVFDWTGDLNRHLKTLFSPTALCPCAFYCGIWDGFNAILLTDYKPVHPPLSYFSDFD